VWLCEDSAGCDMGTLRPQGMLQKVLEQHGFQGYLELSVESRPLYIFLVYPLSLSIGEFMVRRRPDLGQGTLLWQVREALALKDSSSPLSTKTPYHISIGVSHMRVPGKLHNACRDFEFCWRHFCSVRSCVCACIP
jgi:hypothetical protein